MRVAIDGNFTHCRYASVEADPQIFSTDYQGFWLTEEELNSACDHVQKNSNNSCSSTCQASHLPGGSLEQCENAHKAARDHGDEATEGVMASKGLMAMVC
ncbi:hypothetical protein M422DRAFT_261229 [Sphaerobolus stellatus SS14]|uniref:Uncharacterized protein n=1 Tax=Sphaerobolus stellatus (strain SS14) TaxID=990650 RepID=A0A0C9VGK5_SPHS4|nr:hypothetical protein M422DRAFT_261229 [Sphaerobolus stellatus SS14]